MINLLSRLRSRETERETTPEIRYRDLLMKLANDEDVPDDQAEEVILAAGRDVSTLENDVRDVRRRLALIANADERGLHEERIVALEEEQEAIRSERERIVSEYDQRLSLVADRVKGERASIAACDASRRDLVQSAPAWIDEACDSLQPRTKAVWRQMKRYEDLRGRYNTGHSEHERLSELIREQSRKLDQLQSIAESIRQLKQQPWAIPSEATAQLDEAELVSA